jgi:hypothetical protein
MQPRSPLKNEKKVEKAFDGMFKHFPPSWRG